MAISVKCDHCGQYSPPSEFTSAPAGWLTFDISMNGRPYNAEGKPSQYSGRLTRHICPLCVSKFKPEHIVSIHKVQAQDKDKLVDDVFRNLIYELIEEQRDA